jgi:uncharacterized membrane protein (DUF2068 family)
MTRMPKPQSSRSEPPGTTRPRRFVPRFHWELLACGVGGHELLGTDAARLRPEDAVFARETETVRWYRCVRCDSWLALEPPARPRVELPPERDEVELPLRGKALRDKVVLRLIAIDRAVHFVALAAVAILIFLFAGHEQAVRRVFYRVLDAVQGSHARTGRGSHSLLGRVEHLFTLQASTLHWIAAAAAAYAVLEGAEAIGLWRQERWAEYLTFVATTLLLPLEVYELSERVSPLKIVALVVNLAVVVYLLLAKRLFGLRGGAAAEREERERDTGWEALERTAPPNGAPASAAENVHARARA